MAITCIILSIGDELVLGQTVDTNSAWLSQQLAAAGCAVSAHMTVPDDQAAIELAIRDSSPRCNFLIISGGIGPTADDLTRQALAAVMNVPLELNESWLAKLEDFFAARGRPMPEINRIQAMIPRGATMIENTCGTAAGIRATLCENRHEGTKARRHERGDKGSGSSEDSPHALSPSPSLRASVPSCLRALCEVFALPGVPHEMKAMFTRDVLPVIQQHANGSVILSRTLHTFGLGESAVAEMLGDLMDRSRNPSVGTTVSHGIVSLRLNARFPSQEEAQRQLDATESACRAALGDLIFGTDDETLPQVVARMLKDSGLKVTTAESCTGGLLAKMLTDIPGSSSYFTHGWVTYANEAKIQLLGVPGNLLTQHGAVSEPVVQAMAAGALERAQATHALAISGIAGPDGGTPAKPVGTVCIALAYPPPVVPPLPTTNYQLSTVQARTFHLFGDREMIRGRAARMALTMLRFHLLGKPLPF